VLSGTAYRSVTLIVADCSRIVRIIEALIIDNYMPTTLCKVVLKEGKPGSLTSDQEKPHPTLPRWQQHQLAKWSKSRPQHG
jgi:hypothetical protein